jgi:hypothetical protein
LRGLNGIRDVRDFVKIRVVKVDLVGSFAYPPRLARIASRNLRVASPWLDWDILQTGKKYAARALPQQLPPPPPS